MLQVRLAGNSDQKIMPAAVLLAEAAALDGKLATQSHYYRGGQSKSEISIGGNPRRQLLPPPPHLVLLMSQEACDRYTADLAPTTLLVADSSFVRWLAPHNSRRTFQFPITQTALAELGQGLANIVALGVLVGLTGCVLETSLRKIVSAHAPRGTEELQQRALSMGADLSDRQSWLYQSQQR